MSRKCLWLPSTPVMPSLGFSTTRHVPVLHCVSILRSSQVLLIFSFSSHIKHVCFLIYFPAVHSPGSPQGLFLPQFADLVPSVLPGSLRSPVSALSESHRDTVSGGILSEGSRSDGAPTAPSRVPLRPPLLTLLCSGLFFKNEKLWDLLTLPASLTVGVTSRRRISGDPMLHSYPKLSHMVTFLSLLLFIL